MKESILGICGMKTWKKDSYSF